VDRTKKDCSNVQRFGDIPLQLLPHILPPLQKYSEYRIGKNTPKKGRTDVAALSIVFDIIRWWDKALLVFETWDISKSGKQIFQDFYHVQYMECRSKWWHMFRLDHKLTIAPYGTPHEVQHLAHSSNEIRFQIN